MLLVFGDSCHVILKMITGYSSGSINCRRLFDIITLFIMSSIELFHILRTNDAQADALDNIKASLPKVHISIENYALVHKPIP